MPKAIVFAQHGGPEVLSYVDVAQPEPGPGQVRIAVRAAGVNPVEYKIRRGEMAKDDPFGTPRQLGTDVAGVVDAVGSGVNSFSVGAEVFGRATDNAYAEYALADDSDLIPKPSSLSWTVAGSLAISAETAYRCLGLLGVTAGSTDKSVLIHGASGGVGSIAAQLAVLRGARVLGTAGKSGQDYVASLGAEPILYGDGWVERVLEKAPDGVNAVLDVSGKGVLAGSVALTGDPAKVITIADRSAAEHGVHYSRGMVTRVDMREVFRDLLPPLVDGRLIVRIAAEFPLDEAAEAHRLSERGHPGGRIVLVASAVAGKETVDAQSA